MADRSKIEWTDATWNPVRGCSRVSPGCGGPGDAGGCYAEELAARFSGTNTKTGAPMWGHGYASMVPRAGGGVAYRWTGKVGLVHSMLDLPLRWRKPRMIFVNSTSDLFHERLPRSDIALVVAHIVASYWHAHQVLTKRPQRARELFNDPAFWEEVEAYVHALDAEAEERGLYDPLARRTDDWRACVPEVDEQNPPPNLWLGTSVEDQERADQRIPILLETPAATRFLSIEPLLGPVTLHPKDKIWEMLSQWYSKDGFDDTGSQPPRERNTTLLPNVDWVICGGESGEKARPMHPDWVRSLRDECARASIPFFFKQWGEWAPTEDDADELIGVDPEVAEHDCAFSMLDAQRMRRVGKARAGHMLDGRPHQEFPRGAMRRLAPPPAT